MADTQEFLDDLLVKYRIRSNMACSEAEDGVYTIDEYQEAQKKINEEFTKAILQHFQQEQETGEPKECLCQLCNREYPVWFAPNDLWNKVMRADGKEEHQFVCPSCFAFKYEREVDPKTVWMLAPQRGLVYTQSEVDRLIREAIDDYIKPHLIYCQEQNGMPYCKNCGLSEQESVDN